jgi:hypothetical protein
MDKNSEKNSAGFRENSHVHVFSNLLRCADCGSVFITSLDCPRKDRYAPSRYICKSKSIGSGCNAKMISKIILGPFIFNYLANLYKAFQADIMVTTEALEKQLLYGSTFDDIVSITGGLQETLNMTKESESYSLIKNNSRQNKQSSSKLVESNSNANEINKLKRALERLDIMCTLVKTRN